MDIADVNDSLNQLTNSLFEVVAPRKCPFCNKKVGKYLICEPCKEKLSYCTEIREDPGYHRCTAPLYMDDMVSKAIDDFVRKGKAENLSYFGYAMAQCSAQRYKDQFDLLSFVPYNKKESRKKHDAARFMCASVCVDWHVTPVETLKKQNEEITAVNQNIFQGKKVLLIDVELGDGDTLRKCVGILMEQGAADVLCLTLAMNRSNEEKMC